MPFRDVDMTDAIASGAEFPASRDARESRLDPFEGYDDPTMPDTRPVPATPDARMRYLGMLDAMLATAGCCPDGYLALSPAEDAIVAQAQADGLPAEALAKLLIDVRREGQLFNILRASTTIMTLERQVRALTDGLARTNNFVQGLPQREEHEAVLLEISHLRDDLRGLALRRAS